MTLTQFKQWLTNRLSELEPTIGRPAGHSEAAIVAEAKRYMYGLGFHDFALTLPDDVPTKTPLTVCNQLRRCLLAIETHPPAVDGGDLSVVQAAQFLGVSRETVYGLCASGDLEHNRIGRRITITSQQLANYRRQSER
jgi:excisionase family DNA binding protein